MKSDSFTSANLDKNENHTGNDDICRNIFPSVTDLRVASSGCVDADDVDNGDGFEEAQPKRD